MQDRLDLMFVPVTVAALAAAAAAPGERVIDVGCGCGATLLELARAVGTVGSVLGLDVSEPMSARARERIAAEGLANATVTVADAAAYAFAGDTDLLFSRFGVMFFADPVAALANLRQAMRPSGRLAFAVWRSPAENTWMMVPLDAARHLFPPSEPSDPTAPGPFAFADPDRLRGILADAGWREAHLAPHEVPIRLADPGQVADATEFATRVGPLSRLLADAPELRDAAVGAVAAALQAHDDAAGIVLAGAIWIVTARA